jgi:hypothetical protein
MISVWWFFAEAVGTLVLMIWVQSMAYRHGIWDGAFNHFLPVVRREMLYYDEHRAKMIFKAEDLTTGDQTDD